MLQEKLWCKQLFGYCIIFFIVYNKCSGGDGTSEEVFPTRSKMAAAAACMQTHNSNAQLSMAHSNIPQGYASMRAEISTCRSTSVC